ncbi:MAG: AsmA-like C-terminal region-containing protein [Bacteroidales bacterium]
MKKIKLTKPAKYILISLGGILGFIIVAAAIVVNFVLTPARLTPVVLEQANNFLKADVSCDAVDITVFSTFPQVGLRLKEGSVISKASHDTITASAQDSLLRFKTCLVKVNPFAFLNSSQVKINKILIDEATIYAYKSKEGAANWDIVAMTDTSAVSVDSVSTDSATFKGAIDIGSIEIRKANMTFDDRSTRLFADLRDFNLRMSGSLTDVQNQINLHLDTRNILLWQQGKLLVNKLGFGLDTRLFVDAKERLYRLEDTHLDVNGMRLLANGSVKKDTVTNNMDVDLSFGLEVPTLKTVLDLIPKSLVNEAVDVTAKGAVMVNGTLKGVYGENRLPVFDAKFLIEKASAQYKGMPYGIDQLDLNMETHLDFDNKAESFVKLNNFRFVGASSTIDCNALVVNPLVDPQVASEIVANVDFTQLAKTFPLKEGVEIKGQIESKLKGKVLLSDVKHENWGRIGLSGSLKLTDVVLSSPVDTFDLKVKTAGFAFGANNADATVAQGKTLLNAIVGFDGLELKMPSGLEAKMNQASVQVKTSPLKDTTSVASMQATVGFSSLNVKMGDSLQLRTGAAQTTVGVEPSKRDKKLAMLQSSLKFDSIYVAFHENVMGLQVVGMDLKSEKESFDSKHWITRGGVGFKNLKMFTPEFPLLITMPASKVTIGDDAITLNGAKVHVGSSDLTVTGQISNLKKVVTEKGTLFGKMAISSDYINCNELTKALEMAPSAEADKKQASAKKASAPVQPETEEPMKLFVVPDGIDFTLDVNVRKVLFGKMEIEDIKGGMVIRNRSIEMNDLNLHTLGANMSTTMVYSTKDTTKAYTGFDLKVKDIIVGKLVEFIPALDTLVPMLRSVDGRVNFQIAAEASLDSTMSINIPSIQSAVRLKGDSLVLMDGETFSQISKMLRFKNAERNVIDSISVDLIVRNGQIEIYPFVITMDRYQAAVGGKHNIDMTFNYHVSLLKSPIPFNVGVDITGSMDDFKFRIVKAKYKNLQNSVRKSPVDSAGVSVRKRIKEVLHEQAKAVMLKRTAPKEEIMN